MKVWQVFPLVEYITTWVVKPSFAAKILHSSVFENFIKELDLG